MITLYQYAISPFCDKVRRVLHVKGVPYRVKEVTILETLKGDLKELSPAGKLPVIDIDGERVADSTDICRLLEARFREPRLLPDDRREQALVHFFEDWADESLYFVEMHLRFGLPHNARRWVPEVVKHDRRFIQRIAPVTVPRVMLQTSRSQGIGRKPIEVIKRDLDRHCYSLTEWLTGRDFLVGEQLSLADIAVYAQMACIAPTAEGADVLRRYEGVRAWMSRVDAATQPKNA